MFEVVEELEESQATFSMREWHQEIESELGPVPRDFSGEHADILRVEPPVWAGWGGEDAEAYVQQWRLARSGSVVLGHIIQANMHIFSPGTEDVPGSLLYSRDPYYLDHADELATLAQELSAAKVSGVAEPHFQRIVMGLVNELDRMTGMPIPPQAIGGREAFMTSTMFHRKHLPNGVLDFSTPIPLLVSNETEGLTRMIPSVFWGVTKDANANS